MAADLYSPDHWSAAFGLSEAPLFGPTEDVVSGVHRVMLDGGHGTFALSVVDSAGSDALAAASWAWSSDIPHHVAVGPDRVVVTRWDMGNEQRVFSPSSVAQRFDVFYRFLVQDRIQETRSVVDHLLEQFRHVRTAVSHSEADDSLSLGVFLALLDSLGSAGDSGQSAIDGEAIALFNRLKEKTLAPLLEQAQRRRSSKADLQLYSTLAIRHAGGLLFQEAHFELMKTPSPDLFGFLDEPKVKPITRGGAHFTPPALARSVVEQALAQIHDLKHRADLVVLDPACGSGAFLHEALRGLARAGFNGRLRLVGRDISGHAITMARFALAKAGRDWHPDGGTIVDVAVGDALVDGAMPAADVIIMNPPFVAVGSLDKVQQDHIDRILGPLKRGRPDLSMAFILRAITCLRPGGVLGCLFPASLLELQAAGPWRQAVNDLAGLRFLANLGDHGLFAYALVQVAAAVFQKDGAAARSDILTVWAADDKDATGEALRGLRSIARKGPSASESRANWRVAWVPPSTLSKSPSWRLRAPEADRLLDGVRGAVGTTVEDLFSVRQGILTGNNNAFVLGEAEWLALGSNERQWFRPALMNRSVDAGRFLDNSYLFFPYEGGKLSLQTEDELQAHLPDYYRRLVQRKGELAKRPSARAQWWALTRPRDWVDSGRPRIVSKYFGGPGAFVADVGAKIAVVQGYKWEPSPRLSRAMEFVGDAKVASSLTFAYAALLNSRFFSLLLGNYAPRVAGGQFNLSARFVKSVPLPDLAQAIIEGLGDNVRSLEEIGRAPELRNPRQADELDRLVLAVYKMPVDRLP